LIVVEFAGSIGSLVLSMCVFGAFRHWYLGQRYLSISEFLHGIVP
jgi:hypothetical protein